MKVRLLVQVSGSRPDGSDWPPPGEVVDMPDDEAAGMIGARTAAPLAKRGARRDPERKRAEAVAEAEADQATANTAHIRAANIRFAAEEAAEAAEKLAADADDAEAEAEELQAAADKAKPGRGPAPHA